MLEMNCQNYNMSKEASYKTTQMRNLSNMRLRNTSSGKHVHVSTREDNPMDVITDDEDWSEDRLWDMEWDPEGHRSKTQDNQSIDSSVFQSQLFGPTYKTYDRTRPPLKTFDETNGVTLEPQPNIDNNQKPLIPDPPSFGRSNILKIKSKEKLAINQKQQPRQRWSSVVRPASSFNKANPSVTPKTILERKPLQRFPIRTQLPKITDTTQEIKQKTTAAKQKSKKHSSSVTTCLPFPRIGNEPPQKTCKISQPRIYIRPKRRPPDASILSLIERERQIITKVESVNELVAKEEPKPKLKPRWKSVIRPNPCFSTPKHIPVTNSKPPNKTKDTYPQQTNIYTELNLLRTDVSLFPWPSISKNKSKKHSVTKQETKPKPRWTSVIRPKSSFSKPQPISPTPVTKAKPPLTTTYPPERKVTTMYKGRPERCSFKTLTTAKTKPTETTVVNKKEQQPRPRWCSVIRPRSSFSKPMPTVVPKLPQPRSAQVRRPQISNPKPPRSHPSKVKPQQPPIDDKPRWSAALRPLSAFPKLKPLRSINDKLQESDTESIISVLEQRDYIIPCICHDVPDFDTLSRPMTPKKRYVQPRIYPNSNVGNLGKKTYAK